MGETEADEHVRQVVSIDKYIGHSSTESIHALRNQHHVLIVKQAVNEPPGFAAAGLAEFRGIDAVETDKEV